MLAYLADSPYGRKHECSSFADLIRHFQHRQALELSIIKEIVGKNAVILPAKEYDAEQIKTLLGASEQSNYRIRRINPKEIALLDDFLYEAIFIPEGVDAPPREIINAPELQVYVKDFGRQEGDICFVAEVEEKIVGAVWVRIMEDYGHVEEGVPSFAISLYNEYRGRGIGTAMMKRMLAELKAEGYPKTSLAVQKANYAVKMYKNVGFEIVDENEEEYIMVCVL
ncbi:MAG: GNAT family N-acetyltransferase [Lachnospiraceae bacterium]|nr:GNAT family N-acetyltransferase [Lachnospiraceae bacterium]